MLKLQNNNELKVQFISINNVWRYVNIGMDQLAGYLREKGFDIRLVYALRRWPSSEIFKSLDMQCQVFAFSVMTANYERCKELAALIKAANPNAIIVMGGGFVTRYYREVFDECSEVDYITLGDGELPTEYLLSSLRANSLENCPSTVVHQSIVTRNDMDGKVVQINAKVVKMPAIDGYEKFFPELNKRKVHCLQTKNNVCTGICSFCTERHGHPIFRDVNEIAAQVQVIHSRFKVTKFFFTDDNILDPNTPAARRHVIELCDALQHLGVKLSYQCYIKALSIHDTPEDHALLDKLRDTGFIEVFVGAEAGNQQDLDLYRKLTTVEENITSVKMLTSHGLFPILGYIAFNPYSTLDRITANFEYLIDVGCTHLFNYIFSFLQLNKYTELYDQVKCDGLLDSPDYVYYDVKYHYRDAQVVRILDYVRCEMIPKFDKIVYHLDWIIYNTREYCWCYHNLPDFSQELAIYQKEDLSVIKNYLSILFVDYDVERFKLVSDKFWNHFYQREARLKEIHDTIIKLTGENVND